MASLDEFAPTYVREQLLVIALANSLIPAKVNTAVDLTVEATGDAAADKAGLVVPIEMIVTSPSSAARGQPFYRHVFRRKAPTQISFVPREGGDHLVVLREVAHNKWWGSIQISVVGSSLQSES